MALHILSIPMGTASVAATLFDGDEPEHGQDQVLLTSSNWRGSSDDSQVRRVRRVVRRVVCGALFAASRRSCREQDALRRRADDDALGNHQKNMRLDIGARTQFVNSRGLDPFATNDVLPQLSLGASYRVLGTRRAVARGGGRLRLRQDVRRALRSDEASLDLRRFTLAAGGALPRAAQSWR